MTTACEDFSEHGSGIIVWRTYCVDYHTPIHAFGSRIRCRGEEHEDECDDKEADGNGVANEAKSAQVESSWWKLLATKTFPENAHDSQQVGRYQTSQRDRRENGECWAVRSPDDEERKDDGDSQSEDHSVDGYIPAGVDFGEEPRIRDASISSERPNKCEQSFLACIRQQMSAFRTYQSCLDAVVTLLIRQQVSRSPTRQEKAIAAA